MKFSSSTKYILEAFIPYSDANLRLAFKPSSFFYELEKRSRLKERTLRSSYYRAIKADLIKLDDRGVPRLTAKGVRKIKPYKPIELSGNTYLLIAFDIPEDERFKRNHLRLLLKELSFKKVQQSIWASKYDHREYIAAEIKEYGLEDYVFVYEAVRLPIV